MADDSRQHQNRSCAEVNLEQQIKADKEYTLVTQIMQVADIIVKVRDRELLPQNLSATAADILFLVDAMGEGVTPAGITRMVLREPHSVGGILMRMGKQGLLRRTRDMEYKNQIRITLTAKGQKVLKQAMKLDGTMNILSRLSVAQKKELRATLMALKEAGIRELHLSPKALPWP
jgi:DNA-binding MarR family transcriptional regulator